MLLCLYGTLTNLIDSDSDMKYVINMSRVGKKPVFGDFDQADSNQAVQPQKMVTSLEFQI